MSRRAVAAALAMLVALPAAAAGQEEAAAEYDEVQEKLTVERAALATLRDQQTSVLEVIDLLEQRARATERRARLLERELQAVRTRRDLARKQEALARQVMDAQVATLSPRLRTMYRLQRRRRLDSLLSARDFASLVRTSRALSTLLERDLALLEETDATVRFHQQSQRTLERLEVWVGARAKQLKRERAVAHGQQALLTSLLEGIATDAKEQARVVRDLQRAEQRLARLVDDFGAEAADSGFASLKGSLTWPTEGMIEVAFGKVVNPRFNTVTYQKGLDIRAREGTPVVAVADGRVAYAGWLRGYGNLLIVDHGSGYHSLLAHLDGFNVSVGDEVSAGDEVGQVGDSGSLKGAYLYFEIRKNGIAVDPVEWLGAAPF